MPEVVDGVWQLELGPANAFLVLADDGRLVMVDTGPPAGAKALAEAVRSAGFRLPDVQLILVTHRHPDHVGGLAELVRGSDAVVAGHALDAAVVSGTAGPPRRSPLALLRDLRQGRAEPAAVTAVFSGDVAVPLPGFTAVHTPGHTAGHTSYLLERGDGVLFTGDAVGNVGDRIRLPPKTYSDDLAVAEMSLNHLTRLKFEAACFGHGPAIATSAKQAFHDCLSEVSAW